MKLAKRIYCVEGVWDYGDRAVEPSVEPLLDMLRRQDLWDYARRDCATTAEFKHYLSREWSRCRTGSVLYLATHGDQGAIWLSDDECLGFETLGELLASDQCEDCLVHFGGCNVFAGDEHATNRRIKAFLAKTGAMGVSGYAATIGWTDTLCESDVVTPVACGLSARTQVLF